MSIKSSLPNVSTPIKNNSTSHLTSSSNRYWQRLQNVNRIVGKEGMIILMVNVVFIASLWGLFTYLV